MSVSVQTNGMAAVDTSTSPYARLRPVSLRAVTLTDSFWAPRRQANRDVVLPAQFQHIQKTGRLDNFRRAAGRFDGPFVGIFFNDSDVYKWLEAASWSLATDPDPALVNMVDATIAEVGAAQGPDGYLNTYFTLDRVAERWSNLKDMHELYCAGHLFQAAVAHHRATGQDSLLRIACRYADYIDTVFGAESEGKRPGTCGHPQVEMSLIELFRDTGNEKYLRLAQFFIDIRGYGHIGGQAYHQDHRPLRELDRMIGHAVRAVYLNAGAADMYLETGESALRLALDRMWRNMVERQMYVHGGIGSRYEGEAFGHDYELPNARAYAETCAAIGSLMWNWRMLAIEGDARYADVIENTLYNAILPGISLDGQSYFYQNPLADDGGHRRQPWFGCACCPPNVARLIAALPGYLYNVSDQGIWVHFYAQNTARLPWGDGQVIELVQRTGYPWDGEIVLQIGANSDEPQDELSLYVRVPGWCEQGAQLTINGQPFSGALTPGAYACLCRQWRRGDEVRLTLPMPVRAVQCHPYALENVGRVALTRGPLLYCIEQADHPGLTLSDVRLPLDQVSQIAISSFQPDLLGGVVTLNVPAISAPLDGQWSGHLYRTASPQPPAAAQPVMLTAVPYYAWANRAPGAMRVWL